MTSTITRSPLADALLDADEIVQQLADLWQPIFSVEVDRTGRITIQLDDPQTADRIVGLALSVGLTDLREPWPHGRSANDTNVYARGTRAGRNVLLFAGQAADQ